MYFMVMDLRASAYQTCSSIFPASNSPTSDEAQQYCSLQQVTATSWYTLALASARSPRLVGQVPRVRSNSFPRMIDFALRLCSSVDLLCQVPAPAHSIGFEDSVTLLES